MNYSLQQKMCILFGERLVSSKKFFQIVDFFGSVESLHSEFFSNSKLKEMLGNGYSALKNDLKNGTVESIIADMEANDVVAVTWYSPEYPDSLRNIDEPPYVLFCKGNRALLCENCLSVVGTRKVSSYGRRIAVDFTRVLCQNFVIVSGLAYGVDSLAHETVLEEGCKTVAVLGSGILNVYPSSNEGLARKILENDGLIISEYGLREEPMYYHFPHRNRLVAGLSKGVLVCQAPLKSGTLSTVELSLNQGKDIFVVPGEIYDKGFAGSNALIKHMQGACVTTPQDIVEYYGINVKKTQSNVIQLNFDEQKICDALALGQKSFDQLVAETQIAPGELNFLLANLELRSIIARLAGNLYRLYGGIE